MTPQEKANNAIIWIDGLSKTRVKQGTGKLGNSKEGYCCLGYGCMKLKIHYDHHYGVSHLFTDSIGLLDELGELKYKKCFKNYNYRRLTQLNDVEKLSFNKISKQIKKHLADLFEPKVAKILIKHYE